MIWEVDAKGQANAVSTIITIVRVLELLSDFEMAGLRMLTIAPCQNLCYHDRIIISFASYIYTEPRHKLMQTCCSKDLAKAN